MIRSLPFAVLTRARGGVSRLAARVDCTGSIVIDGRYPVTIYATGLFPVAPMWNQRGPAARQPSRNEKARRLTTLQRNRSDQRVSDQQSEMFDFIRSGLTLQKNLSHRPGDDLQVR